ncbi:Coagulation factor IX (Fragment) [Seminavis robusta]|uniref:Coagulation factor IX n=1 Tax=Seminavis robusta TaxID=568900 RepID=A0A9N8E1R6_9STRA
MSKVAFVAVLTGLLASSVGADPDMVRWGEGGLPEDAELDNFIIGGTDVVPGELPFYGHFQGVTMCGGALIHEDIFVTAAHCLEDGFPSTIRIGATTTVSANEGIEVPVCAGIIHPNNNMKSMENDIAILKLCDQVKINSYAEYDTSTAEPPTGQDFWIVGFGRTSVNGNLSPFLKKAKVDYLNSAVCAGRYTKYDALENMCVDGATTAICYGDSGGPLLDVNNKVFGFASFIIDTCGSEYPDFFTRVSTYAGWLREMTCTQAINPPMECAVASGGTGNGGGNPSQGNEGGDPAAPADALTECLNVLVGLIQSLATILGG